MIYSLPQPLLLCYGAQERVWLNTIHTHSWTFCPYIFLITDSFTDALTIAVSPNVVCRITKLSFTKTFATDSTSKSVWIGPSKGVRLAEELYTFKLQLSLGPYSLAMWALLEIIPCDHFIMAIYICFITLKYYSQMVVEYLHNLNDHEIKAGYERTSSSQLSLFYTNHNSFSINLLNHLHNPQLVKSDHHYWYKPFIKNFNIPLFHTECRAPLVYVSKSNVN